MRSKRISTARCAIPASVSLSGRLRFADLFAGLGGFHIGLARLGHVCVFACEADPELRGVYERNFGLEPAGDIREVDESNVPDHDVLCAGFPCQPFSKAGDQEGLACPEFGTLFSHVVRILREKLPRYVLLENVPNLMRHDHGRTWRGMAAELRKLGYFVEAEVLSPHHFGVPQLRERLFVVGSRDGLGSFRWPTPEQRETTITSVLDAAPVGAKALSEVHEQALDLWQEFLDRLPPAMDLPGFPIWTPEFRASYPFEGIAPLILPTSKLGQYRGSHGRPLSGLRGETLREALPPYARGGERRFPAWKERFIRQNREFYWQAKRHLEGWLERVSTLPESLQKLEWNCHGEARRIRDHLVQFRPSGVRVKRANFAPALVAMNPSLVPVVPWESRYMSATECARLQGLHGLKNLPLGEDAAFKALGNAVNVEVVARIGRALLQDVSLAPVAIELRNSSQPSAMADSAQADSALPGRISIRPGVSVLSVLRHLNYQPWYALAEFVDNSLQSFLAHRLDIGRADGRKAKLRIDITVDPRASTIVIRDNAAGIHARDYQRAFRAAEVPPDRTGLSEFGMGMKSAACWLAPRWTVRTKALGEDAERTIAFDISKIVRDSIEELSFSSSRALRRAHYTEITLSGIYRMPVTRTLAKIRTHLASIYRTFIRKRLLEIRINGEPALQYEEPSVLIAPPIGKPRSHAVAWRKRIDIALGGERRVRGFAAIREVGSTSGAGFALFRRGRLIQGSADEGYRPALIFGRSNSFVYQRLFGELELEGFDVSHTKDGVRWDEAEDDFLALLKQELDSAPLELLRQAREYRAKPSRKDSRAAAGGSPDRASLQQVGRQERLAHPGPGPGIRAGARFSSKSSPSKRVIQLERNGTEWEISVELCRHAIDAWYEVFDQEPRRGVRRLAVRLSLIHPLNSLLGATRSRSLEGIVRLAAALGLAEVTARDAGVRKAGAVRHNLNELLSEAFSI